VGLLYFHVIEVNGECERIRYKGEYLGIWGKRKLESTAWFGACNNFRSRKLGWAEYVPYAGDVRYSYKTLVGKFERWTHMQLRLDNQPLLWLVFHAKMKESYSSEMFVSTYHTTHCNQ